MKKLIMDRPIRPDEVRSMRIDYIPSIIFATINRLILERFDGKKVTIKQEEILDEVCTEESGLTREMVFDNHYLDIEGFYRNEGWHVEYDQPGFCENYPPTFTFSLV